MDISKRCKEFFGLQPFLSPFGNKLDEKQIPFMWPAMEEVIDAIVEAVRRRKFLVVAGSACSAKTTAWNEAKRRLAEDYPIIHFCEPKGLAPDMYSEQTIYVAIKRTLQPPVEGDRNTMFRRAREDRAYQCRQLMETENAAKHPVCLSVNDAHECRPAFLLCCKRMWDDQHGFDRLLSVICIGQPGLLSLVGGRSEINERCEVIRMPSLGRNLGDYLAYEWARCSVDNSHEAPFSECALEELSKLANKNWLLARDHPLELNNVIARSMDIAFRAKIQTISRDVITRAMTADMEDRTGGGR